MNKKESALQSAVTDQQGSKKTQLDFNLLRPFTKVKSKFLEDQEYFQNTFIRFKLLSFCQHMLWDRKIIHENSNFAKCHRVTIGAVASLVRNPQTDRAYYNHVATCANSKACPVCASRIMGKRSAEIKKAVYLWLSFSPENTCYMLTLTFAHCVTDKLIDLLMAFKKACKSFWENGSVARLFKVSGRVGRITSTEFQYSRKNGFHCHQHILIFCKKTSFDIELLRRYWLAALEASGLSGLSDIALDLMEARSVSDYLCKISSEMAMGNVKQGRVSGHYSPMQILFEAASGCSWAADVFCEYFIATKGIHSLCWSRGLKALFGIDEVSDEAITEGKAQEDLTSFMAFVGFSKLTASEKSLLRNYAAVNDWPSAVSLLEKHGFKYWEKYSEE